MGERKHPKAKVDPDNARYHDERNKDVIRRSLDELGAGRSIVVDARGVVIGGNETLTQAEALGLELEYIHTNGDKLIVVVRDDLAPDDPKRIALSIADNRSTDLSFFDSATLAGLGMKLQAVKMDLTVTGFELNEWPDELTDHINDGSSKNKDDGEDPSPYSDEYQVLVIELTEEAQSNLLQKLSEEGFKCRALIL